MLSGDEQPDPRVRRHRPRHHELDGGGVGVSGSANGANGYGVSGFAAGDSGTGVRGYVNGVNAIAVGGWSDGINGIGVQGHHTSAAGAAPGVYGATESVDANAEGVRGTSGGWNVCDTYSYIKNGDLSY